MSRVVVGVSGGVDSTMAALLLKRRGFEVLGLSLLIGPESQQRDTLAAAATACAQIGVAHEVVPLGPQFEQEVIAPTVEAYLGGRTPNPCAWCNPRVKLAALLRRALELDAQVATGHYARVVRVDGAPCVARAADPTKDQSYFLYRLEAEQRRRLVLPMGELRKVDVKAMARAEGLAASTRPESQEACFAGEEGMARLVEARAPGRVRPGDVVTSSGERLGAHQGVHRFTVGQRRGIGVGGGPRRYVVAIDAASGRVVVDQEQGLWAERLRLADLHLCVPATRLTAQPVQVQIRARHRAAEAEVALEPEGATVRFEAPQRAPAPGQVAVFYRDGVVLGGGIIQA